ncbi:heterokaryon incompatibility protein-domain-containing protein [Plectosphaerella plurivora]|uniref:Heterokaryon incompatibility protein-domain-containing protein n=1 Tax=Plectosphaerella plurivora TaxID=936078 RepID=A0A9P9A8B1_9PEZI|nr:heterokaryon incompatibility protein-domain-containing protein [Plectosphaerella plurivora]
MRLINTKTLRFHDFTHSIPSYAILSHRWRPGEVSLKRFVRPSLRGLKPGFAKIQAACREARNYGLYYVWVDTCCIDKTSSAELGEAINSMFKWYQEAAVCFAYLDDVPIRQTVDDQAPTSEKPFTKSLLPRYTEDSFAQSKWFTRGWTLQELIAPRLIHFYDKEWGLIGKKHEMTSELQSITGVDRFVLQGGSLEEIPAGRRMSWAVDRETTREEDIAYSLFGIFNVNLPLVYGEGPRAFLRLQEQILYKSNDHTLLAWRRSLGDGEQRMRGLLAESPRDFRHFRKHTAEMPSHGTISSE